jgi:hypothetical protein
LTAPRGVMASDEEFKSISISIWKFEIDGLAPRAIALTRLFLSK